MKEDNATNPSSAKGMVLRAPSLDEKAPKKVSNVQDIEDFDVKNSFTSGGIELEIKYGMKKAFPLSPETALKMSKALAAAAEFAKKVQ